MQERACFPEKGLYGLRTALGYKYTTISNIFITPTPRDETKTENRCPVAVGWGGGAGGKVHTVDGSATASDSVEAIR